MGPARNSVVSGVSAGYLVWIEPGGWDPVRSAVVHDGLPAHLLVVAVVGAARQGTVADGGGAAVLPVLDVVGFEPGGGSGVAVGEGAAFVAGKHG